MLPIPTPTSREALYQKLWTRPIPELLNRYGVCELTFLTTCRRLSGGGSQSDPLLEVAGMQRCGVDERHDTDQRRLALAALHRGGGLVEAAPRYHVGPAGLSGVVEALPRQEAWLCGNPDTQSVHGLGLARQSDVGQKSEVDDFEAGAGRGHGGIQSVEGIVMLSEIGVKLWHHYTMGRTAADRVTDLMSDGQVWTGQLLAQRSGLSLRTVRRAVAGLREAGVAIDTDAGRGGGIRIGARSALPSVRLSHREAIGMLFALAVAESLGLPLLGGGLASLRRRLSSTFAPTERTHVQRLRERILVGRPASEAVRNTWHEPDAGQAQLLQEAFISSRVVQFQYRARDQRLSRRRGAAVLAAQPSGLVSAGTRSLHRCRPDVSAGWHRAAAGT